MSRKSILALAAIAALSTSCLVSGAAFAAPASDCVQSDNPVRVIRDCTEILRGDPTNAVARFKRGKAYLDDRTDTRDLPLAIADLTKAIEIDPKHTDAHHQRGIAFRRKGDPARAIANQSKASDKAIALDPVYAGAYFYRSFLSALNGDMNRAVEDLKQTFKLRDRDVDDILRTLSPTERSKALAFFAALFKRIDQNSLHEIEAGRRAKANTENKSCWRPGMSRNIAIAEQACDPLTSKPPMSPK
jgi:tetratricopeptide (TPR) repeat protein